MQQKPSFFGKTRFLFVLCIFFLYEKSYFLQLQTISFTLLILDLQDVCFFLYLLGHRIDFRCRISEGCV